MNDQLKTVFRLVHVTSWVAILSSLAGSILMFIVGAKKTVLAFKYAFFVTPSDEKMAHLSTGDVATTYLIKSLDAFLIGFVLFLFAYGIYRLFLSDDEEAGAPMFRWISLPTIGHLKQILAEVIVIILFVKFLEIVLVNLETLEWPVLVLPRGILLLAVALRMMNLTEHSLKDKE